ncbi:mitochondrial putative hexaprenyl pyrophosphate synthase [Blastocladiella britannica]|nr:mitochondrial putative hexaprenyl pyrophosphate synthase [Blastocladiella britannica]
MDLVGKDMASLTRNIRALLTPETQVLRRMAQYYFHRDGKHVRPLLVLLTSQAVRATVPVGAVPPTPRTAPGAPADRASINSSISPALTGFGSIDAVVGADGILPAQRRLAEIAEMIHTASLLHDDVIDGSSTRRGVPSVNAEQGNKMAILAGDYLLARASMALARLRHCEVVELLAAVIADLVEGEVMQLRNTAGADTAPANGWQSPSPVPVPGGSSPALDHYLEKTYLKTASLMAKSCQAAAVLGGAPQTISATADTYGKHLGLAFQLVDDMLDFTASAADFGKPAGGADLDLGLATAPVLFAAREHPELLVMAERRFSGPGDAKRAFDLVHASQGLHLTREWAVAHAQFAVQAISVWPATPARDALVGMAEKVLTRSK